MPFVASICVNLFQLPLVFVHFLNVDHAFHEKKPLTNRFSASTKNNDSIMFQGECYNILRPFLKSIFIPKKVAFSPFFGLFSFLFPLLEDFFRSSESDLGPGHCAVTARDTQLHLFPGLATATVERGSGLGDFMIFMVGHMRQR